MIRRLINITILFTAFGAAGQQIEIAVQKGHSADITFAVFNSTGTLLATSGKDNLLKLWHVPTGKEMASFVSAHDRVIVSLLFSSNDDLLHVRYDDGVVHSWDIASSSRMPSDNARTLRFPQQRRHLTADSASMVFIEDFYLRKTHRATGRKVFSKVPVDISNDFTSVAVSEKYAVIVAGSEDGKVYVYDFNSGKNRAVLDAHYSSVNSVCLSPDETVFATASSDRSIILWDTRTLTMIRRLHGRSFRYEALAFDHTGNVLAVGDELGYGKLIDLQSSRVNVSSFRWHSQKVSAIAFDGNRRIFTAGFDNRINIFDPEAGEIADEAKYLNYVSGGDFVLKALDAYREPYAWVNTLSISPGSNYVVAGGAWRESIVRRQPQPLWIHDIAHGITRKLPSHQGAVTAVSFVSSLSFLSASGNDLFHWYIDPGNNDVYFRKLAGDGEDIKSIGALSRDTVVIQRNDGIELFSVSKESVLARIVPGQITAMAVQPGRAPRIAYAQGTSLVIRKLLSGDAGEVRIAKAHTDRITAIAFSPSRPIIATCGWDATVRLWNSDTGEQLATIVSVGRDDHIIITPDGYYFGTRNALKGIGFKYGKQFISPEQFDLRYNRPDIVLQRLGFVPDRIVRAYNRAWLKRLQKMNFTEEMLSSDVHLPQTKILTEKLPLSTTESSIRFQVQAFDSRYKIDRINVFVNNIPVYGLEGINVRDERSSDITREITLQLSSGRNRIQISCLNEKGVESLLETFETELRQEAEKPDLYLAVISVSGYSDSRMNLKYAAKDGRDLVSLLTRKNQHYRRVFIDTLFDRRATRENILALRQRLAEADVDDQVILFASGHGLLDEKLDFYLATHDIDFGNPSGRGVRYEEMENLLDGIRSRHKLLLIDACHSGEVDKSRLKVSSDQTAVLAKNQKGTLKTYTYGTDAAEEHYQVGIKTSFELMQELFANVSRGSGAVVISAAAGNSYALESDVWRNGVFTYALLSGLRNRTADRNRNGSVTVTELKDFVSTEVERLTNGEQKPTSRRENLEFDFIIW